MPTAASSQHKISRRRANARRRGQAALEYMVTAGVLLTLFVMLALFLHTFKEYGGRILNLVASEYP